MKKDENFKLVAICGKAGAGKDYLLHKIINDYGTKYFHEIISCTTRPPRENEQNGVNYYFLSNEKFAEKVFNGEMLEATIFNDWCYGTATQSLDHNKVNIGVFNPVGIEALMQDDRIDLTVFLVEAPSKDRIIRQLQRENNPDINEIFRRYKADEEDFDGFEYLGCEYSIVKNGINYSQIEEAAMIIDNIGYEFYMGQK